MFLPTRKMRRALKVIVSVCLLAFAVYFFNSHLGDQSDEATRLRNFATQMKQKVKSDSSYQNSQTLVERLKPKLQQKDVWNDLGVARNNQEVLERERGYKDFSFNTLVSSRIGLRQGFFLHLFRLSQTCYYLPENFTIKVIFCIRLNIYIFFLFQVS